MAKRWLPAAGLLAALLLAAAAPASAGTRFAEPGASGANPCNPAPCGLSLAVSGAKDGDLVFLAPGTYVLTSDLVIDKAISVGGSPGPGPNLVLDNSSVIVDHADAVLQAVQISIAAPTMAYALQQESGTTARVYVDGSNGSACHVSSGTIRDSACFGGLAVAPGDPGSYQATVRNVTADPLLVGAFGGASLNATVTNTAALPASGLGSSPEALLIDVSAGSSASVVLTNSSYNAVDTTLSTGKDFTFTPVGTNGNQIASPQFVNPATGNFRPLETSPTIDAGVGGEPPFSLGLGGGLRSQPRCIGGTPVPDIGAYEFAPTELCPGGASGSGGSVPLPKVVSVLPGSTSPVKLRKLRRNPARGMATLPVTVAAAGTVTLSGKGVVRRQLRAKGRATLRLLVAAKGRKAKLLRNEGEVRLTVTVTFVGRDGARTVVTRPLKLRLRPAS